MLLKFLTENVIDYGDIGDQTCEIKAYWLFIRSNITFGIEIVNRKSRLQLL